MLHLAQHFVSDGGMNHCNFLLPASNFKIFSQNILRLMLFSSKPNFRHAHQFSFSINKIKGSDPSLIPGLFIWCMILPVNSCMLAAPWMFAKDGVEPSQLACTGIETTQVSISTSWKDVHLTLPVVVM